MNQVLECLSRIGFHASPHLDQSLDKCLPCACQYVVPVMCHMHVRTIRMSIWLDECTRYTEHTHMPIAIGYAYVTVTYGAVAYPYVGVAIQCTCTVHTYSVPMHCTCTVYAYTERAFRCWPANHVQTYTYRP